MNSLEQRARGLVEKVRKFADELTQSSSRKAGQPWIEAQARQDVGHRLNALLDTLAAEGVQAGEVAGWVLEDTFVNAKFWTADTPPQGWTPVYYTAPPSAPVGVEKALDVLEQAAKGGSIINTQLVWSGDVDKAIRTVRNALAQQPERMENDRYPEVEENKQVTSKHCTCSTDPSITCIVHPRGRSRC